MTSKSLIRLVKGPMLKDALSNLRYLQKMFSNNALLNDKQIFIKLESFQMMKCPLIKLTYLQKCSLASPHLNDEQFLNWEVAR